MKKTYCILLISLCLIFQHLEPCNWYSLKHIASKIALIGSFFALCVYCVNWQNHKKDEKTFNSSIINKPKFLFKDEKKLNNSSQKDESISNNITTIINVISPSPENKTDLQHVNKKKITNTLVRTNTILSHLKTGYMKPSEEIIKSRL